MELKDFIGKVVINNTTKRRYILTTIDGAYISAREEAPKENGTYTYLRWLTGTTPGSNAISNGTLVFEDNTLTEAFDKAYEEYFFTDGKMDQYIYYMSKYD